MRLACLTHDPALERMIHEAAENQSWLVLKVNSQEEFKKLSNESPPDLLLVELRTAADLDWLGEKGQPAVFVGHSLNEELVGRAVDAGGVGFLPLSLISTKIISAKLQAFENLQSMRGRWRTSDLGVTVDYNHRCVELGGQRAVLTSTEFKILHTLVMHEGQAVSRLTLEERIFARDHYGRRSLDVHVCALRRKIKPLGLTVTSVRGVGYRIARAAGWRPPETHE